MLLSKNEIKYNFLDKTKKIACEYIVVTLEYFCLKVYKYIVFWPNILYSYFYFYKIYRWYFEL